MFILFDIQDWHQFERLKPIRLLWIVRSLSRSHAVGPQMVDDPLRGLHNILH